jgi:uncharacterized membrane protein YhhN
MAPSWLTLAGIAVLVSAGTVAVVAADTGRRTLLRVFKPAATLALLAVLGWPASAAGWLVAAGVVASLAGDVALLRRSDRAFLAGLASFLVAHVLYVVAFLGVATLSPWTWGAGVGVLAAIGLLLPAIWPGVAPRLRLPVCCYAAAIGAMVVSAASTQGGRLGGAAWFAAAGATLFFVADSSLALNRFRRPIPHEAVLTMGVYWLGQLGIVLSVQGR